MHIAEKAKKVMLAELTSPCCEGPLAAQLSVVPYSSLRGTTHPLAIEGAPCAAFD